MREKVQEAISWTRSERFEDAIVVFEKYLPKLFSDGDIQDKRFAATAFSYYGLCVAMVKHKYAEALKYCNVSVKANFMDPEHRINLAMVYLERNDRKNAVRNLEAGLRLQPSKQTHPEDLRRHRPAKTGDLLVSFETQSHQRLAGAVAGLLTGDAWLRCAGSRGKICPCHQDLGGLSCPL